MNFTKSTKFWCFIAGCASTLIGKKILKAKKTRELAVKGLAKGMKFAYDTKTVFQDMKDEASDICNDAKEEAGLQEK